LSRLTKHATLLVYKRTEVAINLGELVYLIFMNVVQFWLIDSIVKATGNAEIVLNQPDSSDREPLFHSDDDGDDDDDAKGVDDAITAPHTCTHPSTTIRLAPDCPPWQLIPPALLERRDFFTASSPAPLLPRSPMAPALNSPDASSETSPAGTNTDRRPKEGWQSWDSEDGVARRHTGAFAGMTKYERSVQNGPPLLSPCCCQQDVSVKSVVAGGMCQQKRAECKGKDSSQAVVPQSTGLESNKFGNNHMSSTSHDDLANFERDGTTDVCD
jgi:hypothetical protein